MHIVVNDVSGLSGAFSTAVSCQCTLIRAGARGQLLHGNYSGVDEAGRIRCRSSCSRHQHEPFFGNIFFLLPERSRNAAETQMTPVLPNSEAPSEPA